MRKLMVWFACLMLISTAVNVIAADDATIQQVENKAETANAKADGNNSRIQGLEADVVNLQGQIDGNNSRIQGLETDVSELQSQVGEVVDVVNNHAQVISNNTSAIQNNAAAIGNNAAAIQANSDAISALPTGGGIKLYDAEHKTIGSLLLFTGDYIWGLTPMDFIFVVALGSGFVNMGGGQYFTSTDCTGASYVFYDFSNNGQNLYKQGYVFPSPTYSYYIPKYAEIKSLILYSRLSGSGVCEDYTYSGKVLVVEVFPNDPAITGLDLVNGPFTMGH